jgi:acyl-CoA reductase-like NAD-dependent aldehyde dehydrogenase
MTMSLGRCGHSRPGARSKWVTVGLPTLGGLGGSDPFIVLCDADLEQAAVQAARARYLNSGRSCIAAERLIVEASVTEDFEQRLVEAVAELSLGDSSKRGTQIGPLARSDLRDALERQVASSVAVRRRARGVGPAAALRRDQAQRVRP